MTSADSDRLGDAAGGSTGVAPVLAGGDDLLRLIVDEAPELIVAFDPQRRFVSINRAYARAFAEVFGRPVSVGQTIDEALAHLPAEQATARSLWERTLAGEQFMVERSFGTEAGETHLFELTYRPLRGADGRVVGGSIVGRDIADRRAAEQALVNRNEELSQSQRIARIGTWKWIVGEPAMRWSGQTFRMLNMDPKRPVPTLDEMATLFELSSYRRLRQALDKAADDGNAFEIDLTAALPYGQRRQLTLRCEALRNSAGHVITLRGTIQDITERWRAEETLRRSDDRWRFAIESTGDAVWDWNIADGQVYVSPRWKEMLGHDPDEDVGGGLDDWRSRLHPDDEPRVMHALLSHLAGNSAAYEAEYRLRAKDGTMRWVLDRGRVIQRDAAGRPSRMIGTQTDVTARHEAEEALARTQADYQLVVDSQNELICKWLPDTTLTFVNEAYSRHFGIKVDRLVGTRFLELVPAAERYAVERVIEKVLADKLPASYEHAAVTSQGELRWHLWKDTPLLDEHGQVRELLSVGIDITERKRMEESLRASEARFAAFMDNCPAAAWTTDRDGLITYANATYRRMFGVGDPTGRRRQDLYPPHLVQQYKQRDDRVLRENRTIEAVEDGLRGDGSPGRFLVYKFPTQGNDGRTVVGGMALDITEREAAERELRRHLDVLEVMARASSRLINLPADEIDSTMSTALEQLGRLMQADRAWMFQVDRAAGVVHNTIEWCAEGVRPEIDNLQQVPMSLLDWMLERLETGQSVMIDAVEAIPDSAAEFRQSLAEQGIQSVLIVPVHASSGLEGFLGFDSVRRQRVWQEPETQALEMVANLAGQVIDRQRTQQALARQLEALSLLVSTSSQLIAATPESALGVFQSTLEQLGRLLDVDRAWLFRMEADGVTASNTVEWCAPGIQAFIDQLQNYSFAGLTWFLDYFARHATIVVDRVADLPPEAAAERAVFESQSIQSCLIVPVVATTGVVGFVGFDSVRRERAWNQSEVDALEVLANTYAQVVERAAAEQAMRHSEARFRTLLDSLPEIAVQGYDEAGRVFYWNDASEEFYGFAREEVLGRSLVDLIFHPPDVEHARLAISRMASTGVAEPPGALELKRRDGSSIHVYSSHTVVQLPGRPTELYCVDMDLGKLHRAEAARSASEERFLLVARSSRDIIWDFDLVTNVGYVSENAVAFLGVSAEDLTRTHDAWVAVIHPDDRDRVTEHYIHFLAGTEASWSAEYRVRRADGSFAEMFDRALILRDPAGRPLRVVGTLMDVSELKQAQAALVASEERFRLAARATRDVIWDLNLERGQIYISENNEEVFGTPTAEVASKPFGWMEFVHPDDRPGVERRLAEALSSNESHWQAEFRVRRADGSYAEVLDRGYVIRDATGRATRVVGAVIDVSDLKRMQAELVASEERFRLMATAGRDVLWDENLETGTHFVSDNSLEMLGIPAERLAASTNAWQEFVHPDDFERIRESYGSARSSATTVQWSADYRFRRMDGTYADVLDRALFVRDAAGNLKRVLCVMTDVSALRAAEVRLRLLETCLARLNDMVIVTELEATPDNESRIIFVNEAFTRRTGYSFEEVRGRSLAFLRGPRTDQGVYRRVGAEFRAGRVAEAEFVFYTKAGQPYTVDLTVVPIKDAAGRVTHGAAVHRDITESREVERHLENLRQRLSMAVRGAGYGVWEYDLGDRRLEWDAAMYALYGHTPESFDGDPASWQACLLEEDRHLVESRFADLQAGLPVHHLIFRIRRHDNGELRYIEANGYLQVDATGLPSRLVGMNRDFTEVMRARQELEESERRLRLVMDNLPDAVFVMDIDDLEAPLRLLYVSPAVRQTHGYEPEELIGRSMLEVLDTDDSARLAPERIARIRSGEQLRFEVTHRHRNGNTIPMEVRTVLIPWQGRTALLGIDRDLGERRRAEQELRDSERRLRLALSAAACVGFVWQASSDRVHRYFSTEPALPATDGFTEQLEDVLARVHPDDRDGFLERLSVVHGEGDRYTNQYRVVRDDGSVAWLEDYGVITRSSDSKVVELLGIVIDVTSRREAEHALRVSEDRWRFALEGAGDGVWDWDLASGQIYYSRRWKQMLGYEDHEIANDLDEWRRLVHPDDLAETERTVARYLSEPHGVHQVELRMRTADGQWKWVRSRGKVIAWDDAGRPTRMLGIHTDISSDRELARRLSETNELLAALPEQVPGVLYQFMRRADGTYCFPYASSGLWDIYEVHPEDVREDAGAAVDRLHADDRDWIVASIEESAETLKPWRAEYRVVLPLQGLRWRRGDARPVRLADGSTLWHGYIHDITERREAERALRENEERLRESQRVAHIGNWLLEVDTGNVVWSEEMYHILGVEPGQPPPSLTDHDRFLAPETLEVVRHHVRRAITLAEPYHIDVEVRRADGRRLWVSVNGLPVKDASGRVYQLRGTMQDIDQRRRAETEREQLQMALLQAQKMESVGRLAGGVAHDFNNMLTVILGHVAMALNQVAPDNPLHADLCEIRDAAQRSSNLTRQLLAFARKQRVEPQVLDVNVTIEGMLRMLRRLIGEGVELEWRPGGDLWRVSMDPSQVDQIMANLLANARDALEGSGRVVIATTNVSIDEGQASATPEAAAGDYVCLTVVDNGPGMDEATRANLFEPFFTTKDPGKGTGLGLATVYGTVRQVGGFITVRSAPGRGTTFAIHLPRTLEPLSPAAPAEAAAPQVGHETVLVAEDEAAILQLTRRILARAGYTVLASNGPREACELAQRHSGPIDLLITDVVMPEMNGSQLKAAIRKLRPGLRTIYVSGYSANEIAAEECESPDFHYIQKPFTVEALLRTVREVLDGPA